MRPNADEDPNPTALAGAGQLPFKWPDGQSVIPRPEGDPGKPGSGGFSIPDELKVKHLWPADHYIRVRVSPHFDVLFFWDLHIARQDLVYGLARTKLKKELCLDKQNSNHVTEVVEEVSDVQLRSSIGANIKQLSSGSPSIPRTPHVWGSLGDSLHDADGAQIELAVCPRHLSSADRGGSCCDVEGGQEAYADDGRDRAGSFNHERERGVARDDDGVAAWYRPLLCTSVVNVVLQDSFCFLRFARKSWLPTLVRLDSDQDGERQINHTSEAQWRTGASRSDSMPTSSPCGSGASTRSDRNRLNLAAWMHGRVSEQTREESGEDL
jgi:hypothetical protein